MKIIFLFFFIVSQIIYASQIQSELVEIPSSFDGIKQKAFVYRASKPNRPLIVSLHSWSGNYQGADTLSKFAKDRDINYIYPDFRGSNTTKDACCSQKAVSDIDDAIMYMQTTAKIDESDITVVGVSGGGMATLCSYFNTQHNNIKQFISFSAMTNLFKWHIETTKQGAKYANDIELCTEMNSNELRKRSPVYSKLNKNTFPKSQLYIMHGIHDGHHGSVPVSHAFDMYNTILKNDNAKEMLYISDAVQNEIISTRKYIKNNTLSKYVGDRKLWFFQDYKNVHIMVFEGYHEMIDDFVFNKIIKEEDEK